MNWLDLNYGVIFAPVLAAIGVLAFAEYALLTLQHPVIIAVAKAVKAAAIPFAVAFYIVLITQQIQL